MQTIVIWTLMVVAPWSSKYEEYAHFLNVADCAEMAAGFKEADTPAFCEPREVPTKGYRLERL